MCSSIELAVFTHPLLSMEITQHTPKQRRICLAMGCVSSPLDHRAQSSRRRLLTLSSKFITATMESPNIWVTNPHHLAPSNIKHYMSTSDTNAYPQRLVRSECSTKLGSVVLKTTKQVSCILPFNLIKSVTAISPKTNRGLQGCTAHIWMSCQKLTMTPHSQRSVKTCKTIRIPRLLENLTVK